MKITTWNVRGLSTLDKRCLVKRALARCSSDIIAIQETKINHDKEDHFIKSCKVWEGFFQEAIGTAGGLGVMWNPSQVKLSLLEKAEHWILCTVFSFKENLNFPLINVYGPTKTLEKAQLWQVLMDKILVMDNDKIVVAGHFSALPDLREKWGGLRMPNKVMEDFREFVKQNHLMDVIHSNGLRQGDPLSPFLFVLMVEVLGRHIKNKVGLGSWKGFLIHDRLPLISHSQFADDTIIFGVASEREALVIRKVLEDYETDSSQSMNKQKSRIYFLNTSKRTQEKITRVLQFSQGSFPIQYLGVPLFAGRLDNRLWEEVVNKCKAKTVLWKNKWLSQAGHIQMIKAVLAVVPIYYMSCYRAPHKALSALDGMLKSFIWEGSREERKIPLISWDTACFLKVDGGIGLRKMNLQNLALGMKLAWKMYSNPQKGWCKLMSLKYMNLNEPKGIFTLANLTGGSPIWKFIWESRRIITEHLSWNSSDGRKAKVWRNSWNRDKALEDEFDDQD
ncbi:uncharacterized protein LOC131858844 [Cryptomeria japonica]|uniref:uncharacterized protein LOC131858844 n=1 Tax=Cryptomeria japonica TaxID=3369 RepID=UPI0027DA79C1|nr:uncharacterized protein LOC131858844 [Cryptomeria japonica]